MAQILQEPLLYSWHCINLTVQGIQLSTEDLKVRHIKHQKYLKYKLVIETSLCNYFFKINAAFLNRQEFGAFGEGIFMILFGQEFPISAE